MILTSNQQDYLETGYFPAADTYIVLRLECQGESLEGEFRHLYMNEGEIFHSISEFIYNLELMLEQINTPQATTDCRKGWERRITRKTKLRKYDVGVEDNPDRKRVLLEEPSKEGLYKSGEYFLIHIRYRCNSSWQGEIRWLKRDYAMMFRSVLELIMVLENTIIQLKGTKMRK